MSVTIHRGFLTVVEPEKKPFEVDTVTCHHCQHVIYLKPQTGGTVYLIPTSVPGRFKEEMGAFCRVCMHPVCLRCHDDGRCTPWEKQLEQLEARDRLLRSVGG